MMVIIALWMNSARVSIPKKIILLREHCISYLFSNLLDLGKMIEQGEYIVKSCCL